MVKNLINVEYNEKIIKTFCVVYAYVEDSEVHVSASYVPAINEDVAVKIFCESHESCEFDYYILKCFLYQENHILSANKGDCNEFLELL